MTRDSQILQTLLNAGGLAELESRVYTVDTPLIGRKPMVLRGNGARIDWVGKAGVCLSLTFERGDPNASNINGYGWTVEDILINHPGKVEPVTANGSTGLMLQNVRGARIVGVNIIGFGTGMQLIGDGNGCVYNEYRMRGIIFCGTSLRTRTLNGGWVNESTFYGGTWQLGPNGQQHLDLQGSHGLAFVRCSFEIGKADSPIWGSITGCTDLTWMKCRWEADRMLPLNLDAQCVRCELLGSTHCDVDWHGDRIGFQPNW